jgi:tRNA pseudouridine38-40 synthase
MTLAYDGTPFHGWQLQPDADTLQGRVETALGRMAGTEVRVTAAGRTDSGVHARGQVAHFDLPRAIPLDGIRKGLNSMLPSEIRALRVEEAVDGFHARFWARSKTYRYYLDRAPVPSPLRSRFTLHYPHPLDRSALDEASARLVGEHDFRALRAASCNAKTTIRRCSRSRFFEESSDASEELVYEIAANGFLHHMVRNIVGTLLEVGRGKRPPSTFDGLFERGERSEAGPKAPAKGLHLVEVEY